MRVHAVPHAATLRLRSSVQLRASLERDRGALVRHGIVSLVTLLDHLCDCATACPSVQLLTAVSEWHSGALQPINRSSECMRKSSHAQQYGTGPYVHCSIPKRVLRCCSTACRCSAAVGPLSSAVCSVCVCCVPGAACGRESGATEAGKRLDSNDSRLFAALPLLRS